MKLIKTYIACRQGWPDISYAGYYISICFESLFIRVYFISFLLLVENDAWNNFIHDLQFAIPMHLVKDINRKYDTIWMLINEDVSDEHKTWLESVTLIVIIFVWCCSRGELLFMSCSSYLSWIAIDDDPWNDLSWLIQQ